MNDQYEWMKFYEAAVLETDPMSLPSRIEAARERHRPACNQNQSRGFGTQGDCSHAQRTVCTQARCVSKSSMSSMQRRSRSRVLR